MQILLDFGYTLVHTQDLRKIATTINDHPNCRNQYAHATQGYRKYHQPPHNT
ncbi:MAG: hypothetical protein AAGI69_13985 [Cyanobacteria bacterium P01_H01_bin.21]